MWSIMQKKKNTIRQSPKLNKADTFFENRNRYFGTLILVSIEELSRRLFMPFLVASL